MASETRIETRQGILTTRRRMRHHLRILKRFQAPNEKHEASRTGIQNGLQNGNSSVQAHGKGKCDAIGGKAKNNQG